MSKERLIAIPEEVRDIYRMWRPTSLYRAARLEEALKNSSEDIITLESYQEFEEKSFHSLCSSNSMLLSYFINRSRQISSF